MHNCCNKEKKAVAAKMPYMISSRSVTDGVSLSVSKSKLVYSSLIFVDNKLTLICLLTSQRLVTVSVRNTHVINLSGEISIFEDKSAMRMGRMK